MQKEYLRHIGKYVLGSGILYSGAKSIIDNIFRNKVEPCFGSIVFCTLLPPVIEHSGVYVGDNSIVHLNRFGLVEKVSFKTFIQDTPAISIYVSSKNGLAIGGEKVGDLALSQLGKQINYNVLGKNCHQFSSGCLTGNFDNKNILLSQLKRTAKLTIGANEWRVLALDH